MRKAFLLDQAHTSVALAVCFALALCGGSALAQDAAKPPLEAGVQKVRLTLEDLRDVGLDLKNILKATSSLYDEVTIQPMRVITEPEVIGMGTIINIPIQTVPAGPVQPANPKRVALAMNNIKPTVQQFQATVDQFMNGEKQLDLPDDIHKMMQPDLDTWASTVTLLSQQEQQLEQLTASAPYNQPAIAQNCQAMQKNIKALDVVRRSIYKTLKKHAKQIGLS
jgi:hypothetical protein